MISCNCALHFLGVFLISSAFICEIVGSSNDPGELNPSKNHTTSVDHLSSQQSVKPLELCNLLGTVKTSFFSDLNSSNDVISKGSTHCDVSGNCSSLTCRALLHGKTKVKAGLELGLCQPRKTLELWMDSWKKSTWSFSPSKVTYRVEIDDNKFKNIWKASKNKKHYLKVHFNVKDTHQNTHLLSLISIVQNCETELETSCENATLVNLANVHFTCDEESQRLKTMEYFSTQRRSRSSRSVWNEDIHKKAEPQASHKIGESCDTQNIFSCQDGASCVKIKGSVGVCKCLSNYVVDSESGVCVESRDKNPSGPPSQPVSGGSSTSAALGALLSVSILMALAAAVFFGTKYHVFSRLRSRLPLQLRCWPWPYFRRSSRLEDNVSMVNPIDDDDPLLL